MVTIITECRGETFKLFIKSHSPWLWTTIIMTTKQLFEKLIKRYRKCIWKITFLSFSRSKAIKICRSMDIQLGICYCAHNEFEIDLLESPVIIRNTPLGEAYWCKPPGKCSSKKEILQMLKKRVEIMESELPNL